MWSEGRTFILRSAIFVGLASVVTTIIYFTPIPDQGFVSSRCERPCHELEMPMICRLRLTLETYQTMSRSCRDCPGNSSSCHQQDCIPGDGQKRSILTANRQISGPSIQVCENDILVVDIINQLPGREVTLHWRGQPQKETPFMDGVAMVTQCPITSATTFQYKFRASRAGTHMWHAHQAGRDGPDLFGALIVRQPESRTTERDLYDVDDRDHVIVASALKSGPSGEQSALMVNGRTHVKKDGVEYLPASFSVTQGKKHRFRLVNTGSGLSGCPISVSVKGHQLLVISLDGNLIVPRAVDTIVVGDGERADFVLDANQRNASYPLRVTTAGACAAHTLPGVATIRYVNADVLEQTPNISNLVDDSSSVRLRTSFDACGRRPEDVCVSDLASSTSMPEELGKTRTDSSLYLSFGYTDDSRSSWTQDSRVPHINNLTFISPTSPLLTQPEESIFDICNQDRRPTRCTGASYCKCVHVIDVPLGNSVELVLLDEGSGDSDHVFHLHGYNFHVVGTNVLPHAVSSTTAMDLDDRGELLSRNLNNPVIKDTIAVPPLGVAALRFKADNPGYWLLEAERAGERMTGLSVVLHVGRDGDTPPTPDDFPRCGNWVGPDFFLI